MTDDTLREECEELLYAFNDCTVSDENISILLAFARAQQAGALDTAQQIALDEQVDADDTKHECDYAYNQACNDIAMKLALKAQATARERNETRTE